MHVCLDTGRGDDMWIFLMIAFVLVMAGAFTLGNAGARYKNKYPCAVKIFLLGYVVFAGCFAGTCWSTARYPTLTILRSAMS